MKYNELNFNKGTVYVPETYTILKDTVVPEANYIGVIAEKNNTLPPCMFFSQKPIIDMTPSDIAEIYMLCFEQCPKAAKIFANELEADSFIDNYDAVDFELWKRTPRLGIFNLGTINGTKEQFHR